MVDENDDQNSSNNDTKRDKQMMEEKDDLISSNDDTKQEQESVDEKHDLNFSNNDTKLGREMMDENDDHNSSNDDTKQGREIVDDKVDHNFSNDDTKQDIKQDSLDMKHKVDIKYDAYSDGTTIHRKYKLRGKQPKKEIKNKKVIIDDDDYGETYDCPKCRQAFQTKTGLLNHIRMHQRVKTYTCALCQANFDTNAKLVSHKVEHANDDRIFLCKVCEMAFTNHCDFLIHETTHTKRTTFKCMECGDYKSTYYFKVHIATHYDRKIPCTMCDKVFQTQGGLNNHFTNSHCDKKLVECGECGKQFKDSKSFKAHFATHTGVKRIQCLYCGKGFVTAQQRDTHTHTHTDERPFECDICYLTFRQSTDMKRHRVTHDGKKLECPICGKKYLHKQYLNQHMNVHKKVNLMHCPICDKGFQNRTCLKAHTLYKHTTEKAYKCDICNMEFRDIGSLKRHNESKSHQRAEYAHKLKKEI